MTATTTRKAVVTTDVFGSVLTLNFSTGDELTIDVNNLSEEIRTQAMLHGLKQKLVDAAAIARNTETGLTATPSDKYFAVKVVYDRITRPDGTWNAIREGVEKQQGGVFMRAMMELTGKTKAQLDVMTKDYTKEQFAALKKNPRIVEIMHRLEREAIAARGADTSDDLLAQLTGIADDAGSDDEQDADPVQSLKKKGNK